MISYMESKVIQTKRTRANSNISYYIFRESSPWMSITTTKFGQAGQAILCGAHLRDHLCGHPGFYMAIQGSDQGHAALGLISSKLK